MLDGTSQDFAYGSPVILSIGTTGNVVANNFSKDRTNASRVWNGDLAEVLIYNELLPVSDMRKIEGYLAHKWSLQGNLVGSHPYKSTPPIPSRPSALAKIYWGGADGGDDATLWENVIDVGEVSVGLRKLTSGVTVVATPPPNESGGSFPASKLLDGALPQDGWRSTWTAWFKENPELIFNLGSTKKLNRIRIYFQPYDREDQLMDLKVCCG